MDFPRRTDPVYWTIVTGYPAELTQSMIAASRLRKWPAGPLGDCIAHAAMRHVEHETIMITGGFDD